MRTAKWLAAGMCAVVLAFVFAACEGSAGPAGAAGNEGAVFVWKGSYADLDAFSAAHPDVHDGWAYYDKSLKQSRVYRNGAWEALAVDFQSEDVTGDSAYIGDNGNWWIGDTDTGELVAGILVISGPTTTLYATNAAFSTAGLTVRIYYSGGTDGTVSYFGEADPDTAGWQVVTDYELFWEGESLTNGDTNITAVAGNKTITVKWNNKIATFIILVQD